MTASYAYMKRWHHDRAHGIMRTRDAIPVSDHVAQLLAAGWSLRAIAEAAGTSPAAVLRLKKRDQARITHPIAEKILAVTSAGMLARANPEGFVRNFGARRRIEALLAIGWRHTDITAGMLAANPAVGTRSQMVLHQIGEWIARRTHDAVCVTYEQLSMTPGPSAKTVRLAAKYGYAPPLAWDDESLDDPEARPDLGSDVDELDDVMVERIVDGTLHIPSNGGARQPAELIEAIRRLAAAGLSDRAIGARVGRSADAVGKTRLREDIASAVAS